jgi:hypothetical protein
MTKKPVVPGFEGKRRTALESIRRFCLACMGGSATLVAECASPACAFHGHRMGVIEQGADRRLVRVITWYCREQCQPGEEPAACTAGKGAVPVLAIQDRAQSIYQRRAAGKAAATCPGAV